MIVIKIIFQFVRKEKKFEYKEHDKQFNKDNNPQGFT